MKNFQELLQEEVMTIDRALKILDISLKDASDKNKLHSQYRKMSLQHHPDRGGNIKVMQDINAAYEVLKRGVDSASKREDMETTRNENARKSRMYATAIKNDLAAKFQPKLFTSYFETIFGEPFQYTIKISPDKMRENDFIHDVYFEVEFYNKDKSTNITFDINIHVIQLFNSFSLGSTNLTYQMGLTTYILHNNKKQKLSKRDWTFDNRSDILSKPEVMFPKDKIEKIASGEKRKGSKFSKRDMETIIIKKLGGRRNGDWWFIPLDNKSLEKDGEQTELAIYRSVFMRMAVWHISEVYKRVKDKDKRFAKTLRAKIKHSSFPETLETVNFFQDIQKRMKKETDIDKMANIIDSMVNTFNQ